MLQMTIEVQRILTILNFNVENINVHHDENAETSLASTQIDADEYSIFIVQNDKSIHDEDVIILVFTSEDEQLQLHMKTDKIESFQQFMSVQAHY